MSFIIRHLTSGLVTSKIFSPPKYYIEPPSEPKVDFHGNVPTVKYERRPIRQPEIGEESLDVAILYCHGNNDDLYLSRNHISLTLDTLQERYPACSFTLVSWDYPTYGISKESSSLLTKEHQRVTADMMLTLLLSYTQDSPARFVMVIGSSLGCFHASSLCSKPKVDAILLLTPFSKLVAGSCYNTFTWAVNDDFDVSSELLDAREGIHISGIFIKDDPVLPPSINIPALQNALDTYEIVDAERNHNFFTGFTGAKDLGHITGDLIALLAGPRLTNSRFILPETKEIPGYCLGEHEIDEGICPNPDLVYDFD